MIYVHAMYILYIYIYIYNIQSPFLGNFLDQTALCPVLCPGLLIFPDVQHSHILYIVLWSTQSNTSTQILSELLKVPSFTSIGNCCQWRWKLVFYLVFHTNLFFFSRKCLQNVTKIAKIFTFWNLAENENKSDNIKMLPKIHMKMVTHISLSKNDSLKWKKMRI
jgi:hypothetical protein